MPEETNTEERDPMAEYKAQLEEHEFLKREGLNAWLDIIFDMFGDKIHEDKRPLIREAIARFIGIGAPRYPLMDGFATALPHIAPTEVEFIDPTYEEETLEGVTRIYDWRTIIDGSTHVEYNATAQRASLFYYEEPLLTLRGAAAESFWDYLQFVRKPATQNGPVFMVPQRLRRQS
jgi:hypothetical protein